MDHDASGLLSVADAIGVIDALPVEPRVVTVKLEAAVGMRLAEDLRADRDYPPFDKSLMDGYAVRSTDVQSFPASLKVIGESAAGQTSSATLERGQAIAVMTGAPIPAGADAVVPIEQTDSPKTFAEVGKQVQAVEFAGAGRNVARRGSDCTSGSVVLPAGAKIGAAQMAVAASVGAVNVRVFDRPRCAVLATGGEIVLVDHVPQPAQIRNSNNPMLLALLTNLGCQNRDLGIVVDDRVAITEQIRAGLRECDVLFVTGGMSMGKYDYVPPILVELGGALRITKLAIRPGKPFVLAAMPQGKYVVGLPGNPVSAYVCTLRLASRLLRRIAGGIAEDEIVKLPLVEAVPANGAREFYQPALIENGNVRPLAWKGSADVFTLAKANALIIRPANAKALQPGELADVLAMP